MWIKLRRGTDQHVYLLEAEGQGHLDGGGGFAHGPNGHVVMAEDVFVQPFLLRDEVI